MKIEYNPRKLLQRISSGIVMGVLLFIAISQYSWVSNSSQADITELIRTLSFSIESGLQHSSGSADFETIIHTISNSELNESELLKKLKEIKEEIIKIYGKDALQEINYYKISPEKDVQVAQITNTLTTDTISFKESIPPGNIRGDNPQFIVLPSENNSNMVKISVSVSRKPNRIVEFRLDLTDYYINKIFTISKSVFKNYSISVFRKLPPNSKVLNQESYTFSPIPLIRDIIFKTRTRWISTISTGFTPWGMGKVPPGEPDRKPAFPQLGPGMNSFEERNEPIPGKSSIYIEILDNNKPLVERLENEQILRWVLITLLIAGIGFAFILILSQIEKISHLRLREKEFIASVTHELRTPLTVIQAAADNIGKGILTKERTIKYGELIADQSIRLSSMIESILLFQDLKAGQKNLLLWRVSEPEI